MPTMRFLLALIFTPRRLRATTLKHWVDTTRRELEERDQNLKRADEEVAA